MRMKLASLVSAIAMVAATLAMVGVGASPARAACSRGWGTGSVVGTIGGAVIGGLIGSRIGGGVGRKVAIGVGVVAGGVLGNQIGRSLDCADRDRAINTHQAALEKQPSGTTSGWRNPDTGYSGTSTPTGKVWYNDRGEPCRNYRTTISDNNRTETANGTACRHNGVWQDTSARSDTQ